MIRPTSALPERSIKQQDSGVDNDGGGGKTALLFEAYSTNKQATLDQITVVYMTQGSKMYEDGLL